MSETTSSYFTLIPSPTVENLLPKPMLGTTVKLNRSNYLLWAHAFRILIGAQNNLTHLLQSPPAATDPAYVTWLTGDYSVMTWLLNSLEEKISDSIMFLTIAKEMWDTVNVLYENKKNSSRVFKIYERLVKLKKREVCPEFYRELKSLINELEMH